jgi:hypothetical protein
LQAFKAKSPPAAARPRNGKGSLAEWKRFSGGILEST